MSPLGPSNPTRVGTVYSKRAETQNKDLKIAFMNMISVLKEEIKKSMKTKLKNGRKSIKQFKTRKWKNNQ